VYRPAATVPAIGPGAGTVTVAEAGTAEWRTVKAAATIAVSGALAR
jgi:hypothetical protein